MRKKSKVSLDIRVAATGPGFSKMMKISSVRFVDGIMLIDASCEVAEDELVENFRVTDDKGFIDHIYKADFKETIGGPPGATPGKTAGVVEATISMHVIDRPEKPIHVKV